MAPPMDDPGKRRLADPEDTVTPKRHQVSRPASPSPQDEEDDNTPFKASLDVVRKDAISRQWMEYMRTSKRLETRVQEAEQRKSDAKTELQSWESNFERLQADLKRMLDDYTLDRASCKSQPDIESMLSDEWIDSNTTHLNKILKEKKGSLKLHNHELANTIEDWTQKRKHLLDGMQTRVDKEMMDEYQRVLTMWADGQEELGETIEQYRESYLKYLILNEELRLSSRKLDLSEQLLQRTRQEVAMAEQQAKEKRQAAPAPVVASSSSSSAAAAASATSAASVSASSSSSSSVPPPPTAETSLSQADVLGPLQETLALRLREAEEVTEQRIRLKQQAAQLELDMMNLPEPVLRRSAAYSRLHQAREFQKDRVHRLEAEVDALQREVVDETRRNRALMEDANKTRDKALDQSRARRTALEEELASVRGQRDNLQAKIDHEKASIADTRASRNEWQQLDDARKKRIDTLEFQVRRRLQIHAAAFTTATRGSNLLYNHVAALDKPNLTLETLTAQKAALDDEIAAIRHRIIEKHSLTDDDTRLLDENVALLAPLAKLEKERHEFIQLFGFDPASDDAEPDIHALQARLDEIRQTNQHLQQQIETYEASETSLLKELDSMAMACQADDEQIVSKIGALMGEEEEVVALQQERVQNNQVFSALNKSRDAHQMVAEALERQIERQMVASRSMKDKERHTINQLASYDRQIALARDISQVYRDKRAELEKQLAQHQQSAQHQREEIARQEQRLADQIRDRENDALAHRRADEDRRLLQRKIDNSTPLIDPDTEARLNREMNDYRQLLNCGACKQRLKTHVLLSCMHLFCKECLDERIDAQKRRCPTCDQPFSSKDMRPLYM
ncbi:hypothetical protein BC940DRAFT_291751 [Gongronella butleri]|nr:hypothetical protein BC940DRAFT_291751 [Gongronella butleri]